MKTIYKTNEQDQLEIIDDYTEGIWIDLCDPSVEEIKEVAEALNIEPQDIISALDLEERAHVDTADHYTLILVDVPYKEKDSGFNGYGTIPLEIISCSLMYPYGIPHQLLNPDQQCCSLQYVPVYQRQL